MVYFYSATFQAIIRAQNNHHILCLSIVNYPWLDLLSKLKCTMHIHLTHCFFILKSLPCLIETTDQQGTSLKKHRNAENANVNWMWQLSLMMHSREWKKLVVFQVISALLSTQSVSFPAGHYEMSGGRKSGVYLVQRLCQKARPF